MNHNRIWVTTLCVAVSLVPATLMAGCAKAKPPDTSSLDQAIAAQSASAAPSASSADTGSASTTDTAAAPVAAPVVAKQAKVESTKATQTQGNTNYGATGDASGSLTKPAKAGKWTFTVTSVEHQPKGPEAADAPAGKEYLFIDITLANGGSSGAKAPASEFKLKTASGAVVAPFPDPNNPGSGTNEGTGSDPVAAGSETSFNMVYVVPKGQTGDTFIFSPAGATVGVKVTIP